MTSTAQHFEARPTTLRPTGPSGARPRPGRALEAADRGAWHATASFPPRPRNVARARQLTRTVLTAWGAAELVDSAELLMSELVTNALRYGRGSVSVSLTLAGGSLQLSVADYGRALPEPREAGEEETGGRGLAIVGALCTDWSVTTRLTGKTVSCRLEIDRRID
ncbi:ATP-binding protein [Kitasatospora sp. NPDC096147]|uniref:ATP-binding protein n=1 Tax=Kitasatospora sp. NPDC096147 TaxID=3364093 RepID=UPI0037F4C974